MHYALDRWFEKKVKPRMKGRAMFIRYADDFVTAFQYRQDAQTFSRILGNRLRKFNLELAKDKTHLKRFSRFHPSGHPDKSINFLGFECYWGKDHQGEPRLKRVTSRKKHKTMLNELYQWVEQNRSKRLNIIMPMLKRKLVGIQNHFGLPDNSKSISRIYNFVLHTLYKWLNRRPQRQSFNWHGFKDMLGYFQIKPLRVSKRLITVDWY
nr:reverse transcriptase domain-containing protein [Catenovulum sediminis]